MSAYKSKISYFRKTVVLAFAAVFVFSSCTFINPADENFVDTMPQPPEMYADESAAESVQVKYLNFDDELLEDARVEQMYLAVEKGINKVEIQCSDIDEAEKLIEQLFDVLAQSYYSDFVKDVLYTTFGSATTVEFTYNELAVENTKVAMQSAEMIADKVFKEGMSDFEKIKTAYEFVGKNIIYDQLEANNPTDAQGYSVSHSMYGAIINKLAVCQGYAQLFNFLLNTQGIQTRIQTSLLLNHAWSIVYYNGYWYHCDITYDDPLPDVKMNVLYTYFMKNDDYMKAIEPRRVENNIKQCQGQSFSFQLYNYEVIVYNGIKNMYKLENGAIAVYELDDENYPTFKKNLVEDVSSFCFTDDFDILYTSRTSGKLFKCSIDGIKTKRFGEFNGLIVGAQFDGEGYEIEVIDNVFAEVTTMYVN